MTKRELLVILDKVDDDARIAVNIGNTGSVIDIKEALFAKAAPDWLKQDEVYLRVPE